MKTLIGILSLFISTQLFANDLTLGCKFKNGEEYLFQDGTKKPMLVKLNKSKIAAKLDGNVYKGNFTKVAKNGFLVFDSKDIADLADQTIAGIILVSPSIYKTGKGTIAFSYHQVGDSDGDWWYTANYSCSVTLK